MRYFLAAVTLLVAACGDGGTGAEVIPAELAGSWVAEPGCLATGCHFTLTPVDDPGNALNVIQDFGITVDLTLTRAGRIEVRALNAGAPVEPIRGNVTVEGQTLILRATDGTVDTVDYQLTPALLSIAFRQDVEVNGQASRVTGAFRRR